MAKANPEAEPLPPLAPQEHQLPQVFRDQVYTSRVLVLPDGRVLAVSKQQLTVDPSDKAALDYLSSHAEFIRQE